MKVNVYLKDMDNFVAMNEVYEKVRKPSIAIYPPHLEKTVQLLPTPKPARTCIQAAKLPNDVDVEIEAIAST